MCFKVLIICRKKKHLTKGWFWCTPSMVQNSPVSSPCVSVWRKGVNASVPSIEELKAQIKSGVVPPQLFIACRHPQLLIPRYVRHCKTASYSITMVGYGGLSFSYMFNYFHIFSYGMESAGIGSKKSHSLENRGLWEQNLPGKWRGQPGAVRNFERLREPHATICIHL